MEVSKADVNKQFKQFDSNLNNKLEKPELARASLNNMGKENKKSQTTGQFFGTMLIGGKDKKGLLPDFDNDKAVSKQELGKLAASSGDKNAFESGDFKKTFPKQHKEGGASIGEKEIKDIENIGSSELKNGNYSTLPETVSDPKVPWDKRMEDVDKSIGQIIGPAISQNPDQSSGAKAWESSLAALSGGEGSGGFDPAQAQTSGATSPTSPLGASPSSGTTSPTGGFGTTSGGGGSQSQSLGMSAPESSLGTTSGSGSTSSTDAFGGISKSAIATSSQGGTSGSGTTSSLGGASGSGTAGSLGGASGSGTTSSLGGTSGLGAAAPTNPLGAGANAGGGDLEQLAALLTDPRNLETAASKNPLEALLPLLNGQNQGQGQGPGPSQAGA